MQALQKHFLTRVVIVLMDIPSPSPRENRAGLGAFVVMVVVVAAVVVVVVVVGGSGGFLSAAFFTIVSAALPMRFDTA